MPMSMLFPSELTPAISAVPSSSSSSTSPAPTDPSAYAAHTSLSLDNSQDEYLLMYHHQHQQLQHMRLQQLQQQQQHQLRHELAQIGLGTPPSSPHECSPFTTTTAVTTPEQCPFIQSPQMMFGQSNLKSAVPGAAEMTGTAIAISTPSTTTTTALHTTCHSYPPLQMLQSQPQSSTASSYFGQTLSNNTVSFAAESPFVATVNTIPGSDGLDLFSVDPITCSMPSSSSNSHTLMCNSASEPHFSSTAGTSSNANSHILSLDTVKTDNSSPTTPMLTTEELALLCTCSKGLQCFGDHETHRSTQADSPLSSYSVMDEEDDMTFMTTKTTTQASSRIRARPKSMIVSSQPYMSPFHMDTTSSPSSPVMMADHYRSRRQSTSGMPSFMSTPISLISSPVTSSCPSSSVYGAGHQPLFQQPQQPMQQQHHQPIRQHQGHYFPQQQNFPHLLDPEMLPPIVDVHTCPVCSRHFNRPYNLRSHIMTHTTLRPYPCHICPWRFSRFHDLQRHTRAKHPGALPLTQPKEPKVAKFKTEEL